MKLLFPTLTICLTLLTGAFAQQPSPTASPIDDDDVVRITTNLIQIDVTVSDKNGKIVTDIKPGEIEIYENGAKQEISNFSFVSNVTELSSPEKRTVNFGAPSRIRPDRVKRTIALIVDDLGLGTSSIYQARRAIKKFVDEQMEEGDLVAIIRTGSGIGSLQQFTNDKRQLYAAIEKIRFNPYGFSTNLGAFYSIAPTDKKDSKKGGKKNSNDDENDAEEYRENVFASGTLGAINYVIRGMKELPGRKSILLLSDGFSLYGSGTTFAKFNQQSSSFKETGRVLENLRSLIDFASRSSVVINTMDAGGLRPFARDEQEGLRFLAKQTGGIAVINDNNLAGGIRKVLNDQSYYLVGYVPSDETFDSRTRRYNKLEVKVTRPEVTVRYRSGFFGVAEEKIKRPVMTREQTLMNALTSPFAVNDIPVRLNALFGASPGGTFIRSLIHVQAKELTFTDEPDGTKKASFELLAVSYGDKGFPVDRLNKVYTLQLKKGAYESVLKKGFVYDLIFPVKKAGAYQLRVAISDGGSSKVGSSNQFVAVPNLKKGKLVLSGVMLENITYDVWKQRQNASAADAAPAVSNHLESTSIRQFRLGSMLNYGFTILNAKMGLGGKPNLSFQMKIFRDGQIFFEGQKQQVPIESQTDPINIPMEASLDLGDGMELGDYVLQIEVTDNSPMANQQLATQFVQFEIVE